VQIWGTGATSMVCYPKAYILSTPIAVNEDETPIIIMCVMVAKRISLQIFISLLEQNKFQNLVTNENIIKLLSNKAFEVEKVL
jgi:hypothetical protein